MSGDPAMVLPSGTEPLLDAIREVIATPGMPGVALVGGFAVTLHVAAAGAEHRATSDIDLVTTSTQPVPEAIELLAAAHESPSRPLRVGGVVIDLISTDPFAAATPAALATADRLFSISHRWAFDEAIPTRLTTRDSTSVIVPVATPAGVLAAKCHAVGYPNAMRRATKHAADLLDLFRLVDLYDRDSGLARSIVAGPGDLAELVAAVVTTEILANPAMAAHAMALASLTPISTDDVVDAVEPFVTELRS